MTTTSEQRPSVDTFCSSGGGLNLGQSCKSGSERETLDLRLYCDVEGFQRLNRAGAIEVLVVGSC
jgi:hypothetical protein